MLAARHAYKFYLSLLLLARLCQSTAVELCELAPQSFAGSPCQQWPVLRQVHFSFVHSQLNVLFMLVHAYTHCKIERNCVQLHGGSEAHYTAWGHQCQLYACIT